LKKFLKKNVDAETDTLAVLDAKLGGIVKDKMGIQCINKCALASCGGAADRVLRIHCTHGSLQASSQAGGRGPQSRMDACMLAETPGLTARYVRLARTHGEHCSLWKHLRVAFCSNAVMELARGVRSQLEGLVAGLAGADLTPMSLGLSHSLSRYKLKFSPDKVGGCAALTGPCHLSLQVGASTSS
jgi:hypothetical protein